MDHQDGARLAVNERLNRLRPNAPSAVIFEGIIHQFQVVQSGEVFEERIAWRGNQHVVARIGEQAKRERVSLAGARGEEHLIGWNYDATLRVIARDGLARRQKSVGIGFVGERARIGQCVEDGLCRIIESAARGI